MKFFLATALILGSLPATLLAWEPNVADLDAAIKTGEFDGYFKNLSAWLNRKTPDDAAKLSEATVAPLFKDRIFSLALCERQLIAKVGSDKLGAFAKADASNQKFLNWLLKNKDALELYLEGALR